MNWNDPVQRANLIERVGRTEYIRQQDEHIRKSVVATVNGYDIRLVKSTRFGDIYMVDGTSTGFSRQDEAEKFANTQPTRTTS